MAIANYRHSRARIVLASGLTVVLMQPFGSWPVMASTGRPSSGPRVVTNALHGSDAQLPATWQVAYPTLLSPENSSVVASVNAAIKSQAESSVASFLARARQSDAQGPRCQEPPPANTYADTQTFTVGLLNDHVFSFVESPYVFLACGAHGTTIEEAFTFDLSTGQALSQADLFATGADVLDRLAAAVAEPLRAKLAQQCPYEPLPDPTQLRQVLKPAAAGPPGAVFVLSEQGLQIRFGENSIASYGCGITVITLPYRQVANILSAKILGAVSAPVDLAALSAFEDCGGYVGGENLSGCEIAALGDWTLRFGTSRSEGLVVNDVQLGDRLFAERMSVPYVDLKTLSCPVGCAFVTRHITLQPDAVETGSDGSPAHVVLLHPPASSDNADSTLRQPYDTRLTVSATYRVYLTNSTDPSGGYLDIEQRYEFYQTIDESQYPDNACEPSQDALFHGGPLQCARWKPIVSYTFNPGNSATTLDSVTVAARLHLTPDDLALGASAVTRDCDDVSKNADWCGKPITLGVPVLGPVDQSITPDHEYVLRAYRTLGIPPQSVPGPRDNLHLTPGSSISIPGYLSTPPGCAECVHMHWRWGDWLSPRDAFGHGKILDGDGDGEPYAVPDSQTRQTLDIAVVAYHSNEETPNNFMDLVQGASTQDLESKFYTEGTEQLNYPAASCSDTNDLLSWGQCGEVLWLSATADSLSWESNANPSFATDQFTNTFFAFGGFFDPTGAGQTPYSVLKDFDPSYTVDGQKQPRFLTMPQGHRVAITLGGLPYVPPGATVKWTDILPTGSSNVTISNTPSTLQCSTDSDPGTGRPEISCTLNTMRSPSSCTLCLSIGADLPPTAGNYDNTIHLTVAGPMNYTMRHSDPIEIYDPATVNAGDNLPSTVQAGASLSMSGGGYAPNSPVAITLHSSPIQLATVRTNGLGSFTTRITLPRDLTPGRHQLITTGRSLSRTPRVLVSVISVAAPHRPSRSTPTIVIIAATCAGLGLLMLLLLVWRKRSVPSPRSSSG